MPASLLLLLLGFPPNTGNPRVVKLTDRNQNGGYQGIRGRGKEELFFNG